MFSGGGFGVGLTVAELALPDQWPADRVPVQLADVLPVHARSAEEKVAELQRLQQLKAMLAGYELDLVAALAADRPDTVDRPPGTSGAAADAADDAAGPGRPAGVSPGQVQRVLGIGLHPIPGRAQQPRRRRDQAVDPGGLQSPASPNPVGPAS